MNDLKKFFGLVAGLGREEIMKQPEDYDIYNPYARLLIDGDCKIDCGFESPLSPRAKVLIHELFLLEDTFQCGFAFSKTQGYNVVIGMNLNTKFKLVDRYVNWLDANAPRFLSMPSYLRELEYCKEICKEYAK